jgi:plastocyanin
MARSRFTDFLAPVLLLLVGAAVLCAQTSPPEERHVEVTARLAPEPQGKPKKTEQHPPAVIWLNPVSSHAFPAAPPGKFTLTQKNKMFTPHLLVVPVGSVVGFPNADPFYHNVFSLFDGRRFDLGLYEAGSSRSVTFSREGVSYIFCNIHAEMSAVVIALATPLYSEADAQGVFHIRDVPDGDYDLHVWIEGQKQNELDRLKRRVHISAASAFLGDIRPSHPEATQHLNKFGMPYEPDAHPIY